MATLLKLYAFCYRKTFFRVPVNCYFSNICFSRRISSKISEVDEQPIKFSTSKAANWSAKKSLEGTGDAPRIQGIVIAICMATFLIYFCILREENDIDEMLGNKDLWKEVPQLEETVIKVAIQEHKKLGKDTAELENALKKTSSSGI